MDWLRRRIITWLRLDFRDIDGVITSAQIAPRAVISEIHVSGVNTYPIEQIVTRMLARETASSLRPEGPLSGARP